MTAGTRSSNGSGHLRICFVTGQLGLGGAERQLYLLCRGLRERGHRVAVITMNGGRDDYWEQALRQSGVELTIIQAMTGRLQRLCIVAAAARKLRADILHAWTFSANLYAAIGGRLAGVPVRLGSERANHKLSRAVLGKYMYVASLWGIDGLVTNSSFEARWLQANRSGLDISLVPNAVEPPADPRSPVQLRADFALPAAGPIVAGVGTLAARKNFSQLVQAAAQLMRTRPELHLVLVGDGPERGALEAEARQRLPAGAVTFLGAVPRAADIMRAFDIVCLPSRAFEGLPNVLLEAAAAGVPAVASRVCGCGEAVVDGVTGLLYPDADTDALANVLGRLLDEPSVRKRMGETGREKILREFGTDRMLDRMLAVYARHVEKRN